MAGDPEKEGHIINRGRRYVIVIYDTFVLLSGGNKTYGLELQCKRNRGSCALFLQNCTSFQILRIMLINPLILHFV